MPIWYTFPSARKFCTSAFWCWLYWSLTFSKVFLLKSWLLNITDLLAHNSSCRCTSPGRLNVFFFLVSLTPLCNDLASLYARVLVCHTSCNGNLLTSSVNFSRPSLNPTFDVIAKMDSSQHTALTNLIIFSYQTVASIYKKKLKECAYTN